MPVGQPERERERETHTHTHTESSDGHPLPPCRLGNEVRSGSTWRWSYESPDGSSKHQGFHSSFSRRQSSPNVTSFASHHSSELRHVTRGSSRHGHRSEQRDVLSHSSWHSRQHYHHRASSYRQASSFRQAHKVSELRQREVTHASGADALRELESYTSARSMVRGSPTTSSLQVILLQGVPRLRLFQPLSVCVCLCVLCL